MKNVFCSMLIIVLGCMATAVAQADKVSWPGTYRYTEGLGMMSWNYLLVIEADGDVLGCSLSIDGMQVMTRVSCAVELEGNTAHVIMASKLPGHMFAEYEPGSELLALEKRQGRLLTHWKSLQPNVNGTASSGEFFRQDH